MAAIPESTFASRLQALDHERLVRFVAALWDASGYETTVDGSVVVTGEGKAGQRLLVVPSRPLGPVRGLPDHDGEIDRLVTVRSTDRRLLGESPDHPSLGPAELRDRLLYGVESSRGEELCQQFLDVRLRGYQSKTTEQTVHFRTVVGALTILALFAGVGAVLSTAFDRPPAESPTDAVEPPPEPDTEPPTQTQSGESADAVANLSPRASGPTLYLGALDNTLYALNADTGDTVWEYTRADAGIGSSPTIVDGVVYVGSGDGALEAIDAETGDQLWRFSDIEGPVFSSPTVASVPETASEEWSVRISTAGQYTGEDANRTRYRRGGNQHLVFVPTFAGQLYALDAQTGALEWQFEGDGTQFVGSPRVTNGTVYVGDNSALYALNASTGARLWSLSPEQAAVVSSPAVTTVASGEGARTLVYANAGGRLYAVDSESGQVVWSLSNVTTTLTALPPTVAETGDNKTVLTVRHSAVVALDASTGTTRWQYNTSAAPTTAPTPGDETVYLGTDNGTVIALEAETGAFRWRFDEPSAGVYTLPTKAGRVLYFGTDNGTVYAVRAESGERLWAQSVSTRWIRSSPTVVTNPAYGDSVDSRVTGGVLGHHDERWSPDALTRRYWTDER